MGEMEQKEDSKIVYFELNNWFRGRHYPDAEPFLTWLRNDFEGLLWNEEWVKKNRLCVVFSLIDMSCNFCITATEEWVQKTCPELLTKYREFLRFRDEDGDIMGNFGDDFLDYCEENIGIKYMV